MRPAGARQRSHRLAERCLDSGGGMQRRRIKEWHGTILRLHQQHDLRTTEDHRLGAGLDQTRDHLAIGRS